MDDRQLLKGVLEGCVLSIIAGEETYGYQLLRKLVDYGFDDLQEGTLYPILKRLEKKEYIRSRLIRSPLGPSRKYYAATPLGRLKLHEFVQMYAKLTQKTLRILKEADA